MRIISGSARGTKLRSVDVEGLRPMLDRVKEALFNIIRDALPGSRVLDLFAGTGALGLEALSRGADRCVFVEQNARLARLIMENAEKCHLADRSEVLRADALALPGAPPTGAGPAGLVLVDPPYAMVEDPHKRAELFKTLDGLCGAWADERALFVLHHSPMPYAVWPTDRLVETDQRIYGRSQLTFLERAGEGTDVGT
ncbi:MAG: 16S rRNA (guanine(966)-N(2))-methyltransferase RsmD [Candidatus Brocadiia bacterium]